MKENQQNKPQPSYSMRIATVENNKFVMNKESFNEAIKAGFFQVEVPKDLHVHIDNLHKFSNYFYQDKKFDGSVEDKYRGFNIKFNQKYEFSANAIEEGYMVDNHKGLKEASDNQVERFSLKKALPNINHWKDYYPKDIESAAEAINKLGLLVLASVLERIGLDKALWSDATGRSIDGEGSHYLLLNHYRENVEKRGLKAHQDWSNLTVLCRKKQPGRHALEAHIDNKWQKIEPSSDHHLIINFGLTLAILTQKLEKQKQVEASVHRVVRQNITGGSIAEFGSLNWPHLCNLFWPHQGQVSLHPF